MRLRRQGKALAWTVVAVLCVVTAGVYLLWAASIARAIESDQRSAWLEYTQKTGRTGAEMSAAFVQNGITPALDTARLKALLTTARYTDAEITHGTQQSGDGYIVVQSRYGKWSPGSGFEGDVLSESTWIRLDERGHPVRLKWSMSSPASGAYARREIDLKTGGVLDTVGPTEFPFAQTE